MPLLDETALAALVREIVRAEIARPEYVSQRTVEAVVGLPRRDYLRLARAGEFSTMRERRLVVARTSDVIAYLERRLTIAAAKPANTEQSSRMAAAGWRRVSR